MRNAIFAMGAIWRERRGSRFAAACLALGFELAGAPAAVADDIDTEPSTSESSEERIVLLILEGGLRYEGTIRNRKMHGEGTITFPDGRIYEGEFADGQIEGEGAYTYPDGRSYVGGFRDGMRNGYGILEFRVGKSTRETGSTTRRTARESSSGPMAKNTWAVFATARWMERAPTPTRMAASGKASGRTESPSEALLLKHRFERLASTHLGEQTPPRTARLIERGQPNAVSSGSPHSAAAAS